MMESKKMCFMFPAFAMKYREFHIERVPGLKEEVDECLSEAARIVDIDLRAFESPRPMLLADAFQNDLQEHYACYVRSCAVSNFLRRNGIPCDMIAGYSMGIFAAFFSSGALSFEHGLILMHNVCTLAHQAIDDDSYGMSVVVGLGFEEVNRLILAHCSDVYVSDVCSEKVIISSGKREELGKLIQAAKEKGCLEAKLLPVARPYHSKLLRHVEGNIRKVLKQLDVKRPERPLISNVDQRILVEADDIEREAAINVWSPLHWVNTVNTLLRLDANVFVECGLSESLSKLAKFFPGNSQCFHPKRFRRLLEMLSTPVSLPVMMKRAIRS